mmetsp:Transcript_31778/g.46869  ORF Transcript_31778/g.46869 Transcript_31778/m.46869 type:complete len:350 (+) Transcript_31778:12-1061(+)
MLSIKIFVTLLSFLYIFQSSAFISASLPRQSIVAFQQSQNMKETQLVLESGISAQVLSSLPLTKLPKTPLVFIHGSFHAAWCWAEHYFKYFSSRGYPVIALSLRGTGGSFAGDGVKKVQIEQHVSDINSFLNKVPEILETKLKPVIISHSFGGVAVMKLLELYPKEASNLSGVITMCSVPPSGNGPMTWRFIRRSLHNSWTITAGFVLKRCIIDDDVCRKLFFGGRKKTLSNGEIDDHGVSDDDIHRYQQHFERDTAAILDVFSLSKVLPSKSAIDGKSPSLSYLPPRLVVGATRDFIVDREGVEETARYYALDEPLFIDSPHDVMLGRNWINGAEAIHNFVEQHCIQK